jgi:hypothetical protein
LAATLCGPSTKGKGKECDAGTTKQLYWPQKGAKDADILTADGRKTPKTGTEAAFVER